MTDADALGKRVYGLDSLRGFAGLSVVSYHFVREYGVTFNDGAQQAWMDRYAHYGVEIFFIISGFVMFLTLSRSPSLWRFIVARIARLAPAFYCCLVITTVVMALHPLPQLPCPTALKLAANLTMAPELLGHEPMDWSYWTLGYEFVFYAMIGTLFVRRGMRHIDWYCLAWMAASAVTQLAMAHIPQRVGEVLLIGYGQFFIIGIALYRFHVGQATRLTALALMVAIGLSGFGASWRAPTPGWLYCAVTLILTGLAWLAITDRIPRLIRTPFAWVATISFPLFLIHQFVGYQIIAALRAAGHPHWASAAIATLCSVAMAVLIYRFVELPARPWIRRILAPRKKIEMAPATPGAGG